MSRPQYTKTVAEMRKYPRIMTENKVGYVLFNEDKDVIDKGKGKIQNLSQSGTLLKTEKPLNGSFVILVTFNADGEKVKVKGRVVNKRESDTPGVYLTGIQFDGSREEKMAAIVTFVKTYYQRRDRSPRKNLYSIKRHDDSDHI